MSWVLGVCGAVAVAAWVALVLQPSPDNVAMSPLRNVAESSPPDLSNCTRLEICYQRSPLECLFPTEQERALLNASEAEYLQAPQTFRVNDREQIRVLARDLAQPVSAEKLQDDVVEPADVNGSVQVTCWRDGEMLTSFGATVQSAPNFWKPLGSIATNAGLLFHYATEDVSNALPPLEIRPFTLRKACAYNLIVLSGMLRGTDRDAELPLPGSWADALMRTPLAEIGGRNRMMESLQCPGAREGRCHYALNAKRLPESPGDTVCLFEARPGWNQCGGPELFTFDHHDPKGGCILLNDGTVRFVRTPDELQTLRWE